MKTKKLITSALPYVNNVPHLGNLIQVLSADVFARFCRSRGYETLYVCGTDEYGTATETRALEEGITPRELCDRYFKIHDEIYNWFEISFDKFGRSSTPQQTEIVQDIFKKLDAAGYIKEKTDTQLYCDSCNRFLADRYVRGTCPSCDYEEARGDQCENCGKLLDPADLVDPKCGTCGNTPSPRETTHLFIDLPAILPKLEAWMEKASVEGAWAKNAIQMTKSWIRDGLHERSITRDLKWGIPVPREGFEDKVFYVWFDAPIGYISITATLIDEWEKWWKNPDEVELFQFIGKDNIPFHTVIFPSSLLGSGDDWTMLHHMSSSEYLNYEDGKFSKSKGVGVFGTDALETGIPADVWRFYIFYNRPEKSDNQFTWKDFQEKVNSELIGNLANLVNRTLTFYNKNFGSSVPAVASDEAFQGQVTPLLEEITAHLEKAELRDGFRKVFLLSSIGNKAFQEAEPWKIVKTNPDTILPLMKDLLYLIRDLAILIEPYIPNTSHRIAAFFDNPSMNWSDLGNRDDLKNVLTPEILFQKLEDKAIDGFREKFSGSQAERAEAEKAAEEKTLPLEEQFRRSVCLKVAKITGISRHPEADKLYIETLSLGEDEDERQIVSGLVPHYSEEELLNRNIILVHNLKPAKLRGIKSSGMLLAADGPGKDGEKRVEVIFADHCEPGTRILLAGDNRTGASEPKRITIDKFFDIPLKVKGGVVHVGDTALTAGDKALTTAEVMEGDVG
ncbi:MAG: methionine--tRNA ligase [Spirochaetales bacterium]|nr:methionine--tRNA ligase [Spirochaetales bacterium]